MSRFVSIEEQDGTNNGTTQYQVTWNAGTTIDPNKEEALTTFLSLFCGLDLLDLDFEKVISEAILMIMPLMDEYVPLKQYMKREKIGKGELKTRIELGALTTCTIGNYEFVKEIDSKDEEFLD